LNCSPLVFDLNGDGIHTTSVDVNPILFDISGDGVEDWVGWTNPGTEEGILYFDDNHNGVIDGGGELFGEASVLLNGERATHGFEALAEYDRHEKGGNGDGVLSPSDGVWGKLRLWVDRDHDGRATSSENYSLGQQHIVEVRLTYVTAGADQNHGVDAHGNAHRLQGTFVQRITGAGSARIATRALHDVFFRVR
jgi:hypothetical protein